MQKSIRLKSNQLSVEIRINENTIKLLLCHMGLVKYHRSHLVKQLHIKIIHKW